MLTSKITKGEKTLSLPFRDVIGWRRKSKHSTSKLKKEKVKRGLCTVITRELKCWYLSRRTGLHHR